MVICIKYSSKVTVRVEKSFTASIKINPKPLAKWFSYYRTNIGEQKNKLMTEQIILITHHLSQKSYILQLPQGYCTVIISVNNTPITYIIIHTKSKNVPVWQCINHAPGLSAINRTILHPGSALHTSLTIGST